MANRFFRLALQLGKLNNRIARKEERILHRTGGYSLRVVRNAIRTAKKKTSRPGEIPKSKTRALKRNSRYEVDIRRGELVIGFTKFPSDAATPIGRRSIPAVINAGGRAKLYFDERKITRPDGRVTTIEPTVVMARYEPRPMLTPHRDAIVAKLKEFTQSTPI